MLWAFASAPCAMTPVEIAQRKLSEAIEGGEAQIDHLANIDGYVYQIFLDQGVFPPAVAATITTESMDRLLAIPEKDIARTMGALSRKVQRYISSVAGIRYRDPPVNDFSLYRLNGEGDPKKVFESEVLNETCPIYLPEEYRSKLVKFGLNEIYINSDGLPVDSGVWSAGPPPQAPRDKYCQQKVGYMGEPGDHGGHLVGAQLGGFGGRFNLTPMNKELNNTIYRKLENVALYCMTTPDVVAGFSSRVITGSDGPRPFAFTLSVYAVSANSCDTPKGVGLAFKNDYPTMDDHYFAELLKLKMREICQNVLYRVNMDCSFSDRIRALKARFGNAVSRQNHRE